MKNRYRLLLFSFFCLTFNGFSQRTYKELMLDNSVNFYEVCAVADAYFETIDKDAKGSGWKGYQRWKYANESKYYPTGDRSNEDPYFVRKQYEQFLAESPKVAEKALFDDGWVEVGPATIDSITGHYAAGLGRIEAFYVDPGDDDIIYFGSRSGGFWSSTDGGLTWNGGSTDFLFASGVNTISASPTNSDSVLINVRNSGNGTTHGIYRSVNGGDTWTETNYNPVVLGKGGLGSNFQVNEIAYHPTVPNLIFIAANDGLYRSTDNLATWLKVTNGSISEIAFHPTNPDIVYIYDYYYWGPNKNKVLRSTNGGLTFTGSPDIVGNDNNTNVHLGVSPICPNCVYFASSNGIWISYDEGINFTFRANPGMSSEGFAISDVDTTLMTYGGIDAYASDNGGFTFDLTASWYLGNVIHGGGSLQVNYFESEHYVHADMREAGCVNGVFYMATDGFLAKSEDGGVTWLRLNDDTGIRENYTLGASQSNHYRTIVGSQDNGTSIKLKSGWIEYAGADGMEGIIHPLNDDWMIGSYQNGTRRRTFNGGQTQGDASPPGHTSAWVAPLAYDPNDHQTIYHFGLDVHKSLDFGSTWEVTGTPSFSGIIQEAAIAENNSSIIVVSNGQDIERSTDGGVTFVDIQGTLPGFYITDIAFDPNRDSTFVVTYDRYQNDGQKVFITHDLGGTWTNITANVNNMPIRGAVIDHSPARNIYLAAEIGVYVKAMDDTDWELYNTDLPNCMVYELEVVNGSNALRAATWGRGVWEYSLKDRNNYPAIVKTWITDPPTYTAPGEESEQYVTSQIVYDWAVSDAHVLWSIDAPTFENEIAMENVADSTWVSVDPLPDFPAGTKVFFKVIAEGSFGDITETYKFMYTVQPYEYCPSFGNMSWATSVTLIDFSDLNNPSGKPAPYTSYVDMDTATVYRTLDYDLTMNINTDGPYTIHGNAWVDWNRDGDFEDAGETYDLGTAYNTPDGPTTLSPKTITVPGYAHLGKTTMRVAAKYAADAGPCETGFDGEVEDYTLFIKEPIDLDFETDETDICAGESMTFTYTGTDLDSILWSFSNGDVTLTSTLMEGTLIFTEPGDYDLTLMGYEGPLTDGGTWPNVVHVHPNFNETAEAEICAGDSYVFGTQTLTEAGEYVEPFLSVHGCDSIVTLTLGVSFVNVSVTVADYVLTANESGATYQWLDCNSDWDWIAGATDQSYTPLENGSYAVVVNDGECVDTSACYDIAALDIKGDDLLNLIIFPNPTQGSFVIQLLKIEPFLSLEIHDAAGKIVYVNTYQNQREIKVDVDLAAGNYYVALKNAENDKKVVKLTIE